MTTTWTTIAFIAFLLAAFCTGQAPPQYSAVPVSHFGPVPGPTQCFSHGPGVLHKWMQVLAHTFCNKINGYEFDCWRNNTATAVWTDNGYPYDLMKANFGDAWESQPPQSCMLQVGVTPGQEDAVTLDSTSCKNAFDIVIDGCHTNTDEPKQGGQLMLGKVTGRYWGTDQIFYTFDTNYQGQDTGGYYSRWVDDAKLGGGYLTAVTQKVMAQSVGKHYNDRL